MLLSLVGLHTYVVESNGDVMTIKKKALVSSLKDESGRAYGFMVGLWFFAYATEVGNDKGGHEKMWVICTKRWRDRIEKDSDSEYGSKLKANWVPKQDNKAIVYVMQGNFYWLKWNKLKPSPDWNGLSATEGQLEIATAIWKGYQKGNRGYVALIHGKKGVGKTTVGAIMARALGLPFVYSFKPWLPGNNLGHFINSADVKRTKPAIIQLDEVDSAFEHILKGSERPTKIPIEIYDRSTWNEFFDYLHMCYSYCIVIMMTNRKPDWFEKTEGRYGNEEPSMIRSGRIDQIFELKGKSKPAKDPYEPDQWYAGDKDVEVKVVPNRV